MWVTPYLGRPGNMIALPPPDSGDAPPSRGDASTGLLSGGTAVFARLHAKRRFQLGYDMLTPDEADVLMNFYARGYGRGPWVYVDPTSLNVLGYDVASCGLRTQADHGWSATSGTLARLGGAPLPTSGVLSWSGYSASATMQPTFDAFAAPVNVPAEAITASVWVKAPTSTTVSIVLVGYDTNGTVAGTVTGSGTAGTAWSPISVSVGAGASALASSAYVLPRVQLPPTGLPATLQIAQAMVEYNAARSGWRRGQGSPRVIIPETPGYATPALGYSSHTLTLAET